MLSKFDRSLIAQAYGVGERDVVADARLIVEWSAPLDDLLVHVCHAHSWSPGGGFHYVRTIRRALLGQLPR